MSQHKEALNAIENGGVARVFIAAAFGWLLAPTIPKSKD